MGGRDLWRKSQAYMDHVKWVAGGADNEMTVTHVASLKNIYIFPCTFLPRPLIGMCHVYSNDAIHRVKERKFSHGRKCPTLLKFEFYGLKIYYL